MKKIILKIKKRNAVLFWFGLLNIIITLYCISVALFTHKSVFGTNAFFKPLKYSFSSAIFLWSMSWILYYLSAINVRKISSWMIGLSVLFENIVMLIQAYRVVPSHYNHATTFDSLMYVLIIIFVLICTISLIYICILFFKQQRFSISQHYTWGLRLGLLIFVVSTTLIGGIMMGMMSHSVGGDDGGPGMFFLNWSKKYGDLRVAQFFGVHSLQIIPTLSFFLFKKKRSVISFSILYAIIILLFIIMAFVELPIG